MSVIETNATSAATTNRRGFMAARSRKRYTAELTASIPAWRR